MTIRVVLADDQAILRAGFKALIDSPRPTSPSSPKPLPAPKPSCSPARTAPASSSWTSACPTWTASPQPTRSPRTTTWPASASSSSPRLRRTTSSRGPSAPGRAASSAKAYSTTELLDAIRVVAAGEALLSPRATQGLLARLTNDPGRLPTLEPDEFRVLTAREREITTLVATGLSNDEIADQLYLTRRTVKTHANRAMTKLGARDRAQLVVLAYEGGLVDIGRPRPNTAHPRLHRHDRPSTVQYRRRAAPREAWVS